jgi:hypothetical protein
MNGMFPSSFHVNRCGGAYREPWLTDIGKGGLVNVLLKKSHVIGAAIESHVLSL